MFYPDTTLSIRNIVTDDRLLRYTGVALPGIAPGTFSMNEESLFAEVLEIPTDADRQAALDSACHGNAALRQRIERLLASHQLQSGILDQGGAGNYLSAKLNGSNTLRVTEQPGDVLGPYALKELIGQGGFGLVFVAEQHQPIQRQVALKIIKPGMDSSEIIARFKAERQALALMDHPNIARVYDADATETGRPYFVMELVRGLAITEYCDRYQLSPSDRLELFITVCQAVQHAHQKGIIHRDLKPGNVLVAQHDGKPVVKVIDFGIAKALHQRLTDYSFNTHSTQMMGTPSYMSPEQAEMGGLNVDTRTDIYSLGVLLYELLAGVTPFERERLETASFDEIRRIIREVEPPRPSLRISTMVGLAATTVSINRKSDPRELSSLFRNELDWVVMKALEKDRERRYSSAADLARDIRRYLEDEPVEASPPSSTYRLRKFIRRHRGPVLAASLIFLLLASGIIGTTLGMIRARTAEKAEAMRAEAESRERQRAELAESEAKANAKRAKETADVATQLVGFLRTDLLGQAGSAAQIGSLFAPNPNLSIREALDRAAISIGDRFKDQPEVEAAIHATLGVSYRQLGQYEKAIAEFRRAVEIRTRYHGADYVDTIDTLHSLAQAYHDAGKANEAIKLFEQVRDSQLATLGIDHRYTLTTLNNLAGAWHIAGRRADALNLYEQVRVARIKLLGPDHPETLCTLHNIGALHLEAGRTTEAIQQLEQVRDAKIKVHGSEHLETLPTLSTLAVAYWKAKRLDQSIPLLEQLAPLYQKLLGEHHPETQRILANLGVNYRDSGRMEDAIGLLQKSHRASRLYPSLSWTSRELLIAFIRSGKKEEARTLVADLVATARTASPQGSIELANTLSNHAATLLHLQAWSDAEPLLREGLAIRKKLQPEAWTTHFTMASLGSAQLNQKKYAEAEPLLINGYQGMIQSENANPSARKGRASEALDHLIQLYIETSKPEEVKKWQAQKNSLAK